MRKLIYYRTIKNRIFKFTGIPGVGIAFELRAEGKWVPVCRESIVYAAAGTRLESRIMDNSFFLMLDDKFGNLFSLGNV